MEANSKGNLNEPSVSRSTVIQLYSILIYQTSKFSSESAGGSTERMNNLRLPVFEAKLSSNGNDCAPEYLLK